MKIWVTEGWSESNSCLPHWFPSFPQNLFLPVSTFQLLQKMTKPVRYFYWSVDLLQLCCLFRCPGLTVLWLSLFLSLSFTFHQGSWIQLWGTFKIVDSNLVSCSISTVSVYFCVQIDTPSINISVIQKLWLSAALFPSPSFTTLQKNR